MNVSSYFTRKEQERGKRELKGDWSGEKERQTATDKGSLREEYQ